MHQDNNKSEPPKALKENTAPAPNQTNTIEEHYRHYILLFREQAELCIGEVFKHDDRIAYCESTDIDNARQYCRQIVDERILVDVAENAHVMPKPEHIVSAMRAINVMAEQPFQGLLSAHLHAHNQPISIEALKSAGQLKSTTAVLLKYAELSRLLCDALAYMPPTQSSGQDSYLGMLIQTEEIDMQDASGVSISLKPAIFEALSQIGPL